jgi:hypothetical protein
MRGRWMVWAGLIAPAAAFCFLAKLAGPGTWLSWIFIVSSGPATAAGVAAAWAIQDRRAEKL